MVSLLSRDGGINLDDYKKQGLLSTKSRQAFEKLEDERGSAIAKAVMLSSLERGNSTIHSCNRESIRKLLKTIQNQHHMKPTEDDWDLIHESIIAWKNDLGYHELVCNLMRTEVGTFSASIPRGYGRQKVVWSDFIDEHFKTFSVEGTDIIVIGMKGSGKTHLAVLLGEEAINKGLYFATNIKISTTNEFVCRANYLSDVFKLCASTNKHIMLIIDEPEAVFSRLQSITKEAKNIGIFFNLTRKLHISIVTIWHFEKDIPNSLSDEIERNWAIKINKIRKKAAFVSGRDMNMLLTGIPDTTLGFKSVGASSAGSFDVDIDVRKVLGRLKQFEEKDESVAKKELLKALTDPLMYLPEYRDRFGADTSQEEKLARVKNIIEDNIDEYLTGTGKTIDFTKICKVHKISQIDARYIKNEIMRNPEIKEKLKKKG